MRNDFMKLLNQMDNVVVEDSPRFKVVKALCDSLEKTGCFTTSTIACIVGHMVIDVDESFVNDAELFDKSVETYTKILLKMKESMDKINPYLFEKVISGGGEPMTLTYKES